MVEEGTIAIFRLQFDGWSEAGAAYLAGLGPTKNRLAQGKATINY